ncbi:hypothetical protein FRC19_011500 [Serendipita sp. 401]|nr:hypothetical protein FRC19_011500 [Serendipita sp. 401]
MNAASALIGFDDLIPFSLMPDLSGGTGGSQFAGLSPISHMPTPPSATATTATSVKTGTSTPSGALPAGLGMGMGASPSSPDQLMASPSKHMEVAEDWHGAGTGQSCPKTKEEVSHALKAAGMSVFGPSEPTTNNNNNTEDQSNSNTSSNSNAMMEDMLSGGADVCSSTSGPKKPMPMADATKLNLDIGTAWRAVRQHPQFEECDIDELCAELAKKATCDGTSKVIEAQQIMDLVHSIPERAKQRKLNLISRPVA